LFILTIAFATVVDEEVVVVVVTVVDEDVVVVAACVFVASQNFLVSFFL
jgi:hypothetical protein